MNGSCRLIALLTAVLIPLGLAALPYTVVDTAQEATFGTAPGQDGMVAGLQPAFVDSADGLTVLDANTGLTWLRSPDTNGDGKLTVEDKLTWEKLEAHIAGLNARHVGGHADWRVPTIKQLYSLIDFRGTDPSGPEASAQSPGLRPFLDTKHFQFRYGGGGRERMIDSQYWSATEYVSRTIHNDATVFGVNFADGRIKGYPKFGPRGRAPMAMYLLAVSGNPDYGTNHFVDNGDGTISDLATGLMWQKGDSGKALGWEEALRQSDSLVLAGHDDWRLPNAKELQSIVDYTRSPDTTASPALPPVFQATGIANEAGKADFPSYWTSTTHQSLRRGFQGGSAVYIAFGRGLGWMPAGQGGYRLLDVHGAGCQRSDPKTGNAADFPHGRGPQGDVIRIRNFARAVRTIRPAG